MPIFISYSHEDKSFATALARNLVDARHNVWIDTWELNAGDSLVSKIQEAIGEADAILVILSKSSISSEWCKRELNSGLVREMEEKRILLIPCVIGDCEIPLFLKEKLYVDFRSDKDNAFDLLDRSLRRVSSHTQSRIEKLEFHTDWSVDWGVINQANIVEWIFVDHGEKLPYVVVSRCRLILDDSASTEAYKSALRTDTHLQYAFTFLSNYVEQNKGGKCSFLIEDAKEISETVHVKGPENEKAILHVSVRRLGIDNGMDTLFHLDENIIKINNYYENLNKYK